MSCKINLLTIYLSDKDTKVKRSIGKYCPICEGITKPTPFYYQLKRQKQKQLLLAKSGRKKAKFQGKETCSKCKIIMKRTKKPFTKARKARGEKPTWLFICRKCGKRVTRAID